MSRRSRHDRPSSRRRLRDALRREIARRARSLSGLAIGTKCATGVPRLVITIRSPFATRSSRRAKWFLASEAPMVFKLFTTRLFLPRAQDGPAIVGQGTAGTVEGVEMGEAPLNSARSGGRGR